MSGKLTTVVLLGICCLLPAAASANPISGSTGGGQSHTNMQPFLALNHIIALVGVFPSGQGSNSSTVIGEVTTFAGNFAPRGWAFCDGQLLSISANQALFAILGTTYGGDGRTTFTLPDLRGRTAIGSGTGPGLTPRPPGQKIGVEQVALTEAQMARHNHSLPQPGYDSENTGGNGSHQNMQPSLALDYSIMALAASPSGSSTAGGIGASFGEPAMAQIRRFAGNFTLGDYACNGQEVSVAGNTDLFSPVGTTYGGDAETTLGLPDLRGRAVIHAGTGPGLTPRPLGQTIGIEEVTLTNTQIPPHTHTLPPPGGVTGITGGSQSHENMQPSLVLNYIIRLDGTYPTEDGGGGLDEGFIGEIAPFAGNFAPRGWALCDGQLLALSQNGALFSILGTTYGGDGRTTFGLPDLRGRVAIGAGTGPGLTPRPLGQKSGVERVTLTEAKMPGHTHVVPEPGVALFFLLGFVGTTLRRGRRSYAK